MQILVARILLVVSGKKFDYRDKAMILNFFKTFQDFRTTEIMKE